MPATHGDAAWPFHTASGCGRKPLTRLLVDPDDLGPVRRQWYVGFLGAAAPDRVVTTRPGAARLVTPAGADDLARPGA